MVLPVLLLQYGPNQDREIRLLQLDMASIIIFSTTWGVLLKEWKGSGRKTEVLVGLGLLVLVLPAVVVGLGNSLKLQATTP